MKTFLAALTLSLAFCAASAEPAPFDPAAAFMKLWEIFHRTESGRVQWHGARVEQRVDTNALTKTTVYADGFEWSEPFTVRKPRPPRDPEASSNRVDRAISARLESIRRQRAAAARQTNTVHAVYGPGSGPEPVRAARTFSKMKLVLALQAAGKWEDVKAWIVANGLYDLYLAAQVVREDDPYFMQGLEALAAAFGLTRAQVEAILKRCVAD